MSALLSVSELVKEFHMKAPRGVRRQKRVVQAVSGVSFEVARGETLGLVGESGSGKTTVGRCVLRLIEPTSGEVLFGGRNLADIDFDEMRQLRRRMQIVFQDPFGSLNPRLPIGDQIEEGLIAHNLGDGPQRLTRVREVLDLVGLPAEYGARYPHEFSGGQRQRIGIA
ncbi:MAG: ATP-binding cassette domain-containing protein, partial [Ilumatobacteraceae bacterium]